MDDKSYKKLVKDSPIFGNFSDDFKKRLLTAKGADMARYADMIEGANTTMAAAQTDFTERNRQTMVNLKEGIRKIEKEKNEHVESRVRKEETRRGENLLEQLKKIN